MAVTTHIVLSGYQGRDGVFRVYVKGHSGALIADEPFAEGTAIVVRDGRAVRP